MYMGWAAMDVVSWALSLFGITSARASRLSDQRAEVFRLAAEVSSEAGRALDILALATPRLSQRCAEVCPEIPEFHNSMMNVLNEQKDAAARIMSMADDYKGRIARGSDRIDWDNAIMRFQEWRATASRIPPWVEGIIQRYDNALDDAGA